MNANNDQIYTLGDDVGVDPLAISYWIRNVDVRSSRWVANPIDGGRHAHGHHGWRSWCNNLLCAIAMITELIRRDRMS
jgi:hypothetical protein